jgi:hypothetical protein
MTTDGLFKTYFRIRLKILDEDCMNDRLPGQRRLNNNNWRVILGWQTARFEDRLQTEERTRAEQLERGTTQ